MTRRLILALLLAALPCSAADDVWTEVRSPNFTVISNNGERHARNIAAQFEMFRAVFAQLFPKTRVDLGKPLIIFAVKNEKGLKELLPAYWEKKGSMQPAGVFQPGMEKMYVALRTDTLGEFPYQVIYHEYVHALMKLNAEFLPLWLNEGIAEFYAHSYMANREATLGRPSEYHLQNLRQQKLMTLEELLTATHGSPFYNEQNKASVFYSQSWALTHFLMMDKTAREGQWLTNYLVKTTQGVSPMDAAQQVFGDLKSFGRKFDTYLRQPAFLGLKTKPATPIDEKTFPARALATAESAALRGDFYIHTNRPVEGKAMLDQALKLDPRSALAHESYGVYYLRKQDWPQAATWFEKATELDSRSFLAYYHAAVLVVQRGGFESEFEKTEARLRKTIELNPSFAPAYSNLAVLYAANEEKLDDALTAANKAIELEPGFLSHRITLAQVLLRQKHVDDAIGLAERVSKAAKDPADQFMASAFLQQAYAYKESLARFEAAKKEEEERAKRRAADREAFEAERAKRAEEAAKRAAAAQLKPGEVAAYGSIAQVTCTGAEAMQVRVTTGTGTVALRAVKRSSVDYVIGMGAGSGRPVSFDPCKSLHGQQVEVVYRAGATRTQPGEIVRIAMLDDPVALGNLPAPPQIVGAPARRVGTAAPESTPAEEPKPSGRAGWSEGRVSAVTCNGGEMRITVDIGGGFSTRLRAANYHKVDFLAAAGVTIADNFQPCTQLRGRNAEVKYYAVDGKPYEGEIASIEIRP